MNVLIVDDQKAIVESLREGIRWEELGVEKVYTACSAREAKLVLVNFPVDVMLSDIEMPEEDGLELCQWAKERLPALECIFLTSHADFSYAREAIRLGSFDYILQPVRYEEVEAVLRKAEGKIRENQSVRQLQNTRKLVVEQRDTILEAICMKLRQGREGDAEQILSTLKELLQPDFKKFSFYPAVVRIIKWKRIINTWDDKLVRLVVRNVLEELFAGAHGVTCIASMQDGSFVILAAVEESLFDEEKWEVGLKEFYDFVEAQMDFSIAVYMGTKLPASEEESRGPAFGGMLTYLAGVGEELNPSGKSGIFKLADGAGEEAEGNEGEAEPVQKAVSYIKANLNKNISRTDVAELVHLNEEYFSRLFKQQTGETFKDYILLEKMKMARTLLERSNLSISIVASKVGYDNFSHFSKMFKKLTDMTPQEYRKEHQK